MGKAAERFTGIEVVEISRYRLLGGLVAYQTAQIVF